MSLIRWTIVFNKVSFCVVMLTTSGHTHGYSLLSETNGSQWVYMGDIIIHGENLTPGPEPYSEKWLRPKTSSMIKSSQKSQLDFRLSYCFLKDTVSLFFFLWVLLFDSLHVLFYTSSLSASQRLKSVRNDMSASPKPLLMTDQFLQHLNSHVYPSSSLRIFQISFLKSLFLSVKKWQKF